MPEWKQGDLLHEFFNSPRPQADHEELIIPACRLHPQPGGSPGTEVVRPIAAWGSQHIQEKGLVSIWGLQWRHLKDATGTLQLPSCLMIAYLLIIQHPLTERFAGLQAGSPHAAEWRQSCTSANYHFWRLLAWGNGSIPRRRPKLRVSPCHVWLHCISSKYLDIWSVWEHLISCGCRTFDLSQPLDLGLNTRGSLMMAEDGAAFFTTPISYNGGNSLLVCNPQAFSSPLFHTTYILSPSHSLLQEKINEL